MPDQVFSLIQDEGKPNQISTGLIVTPAKRVISYLLQPGKVEGDVTCANEPDPDYLPLVGVRTRRVGEQYPYKGIQGFRSGNAVEVRAYMQKEGQPLPPPVRVQVYLQFSLVRLLNVTRYVSLLLKQTQ
ncbi:MAG: hypothetical protein ABFS30_15595, partial [Pseudomonadota bacterium]